MGVIKLEIQSTPYTYILEWIKEGKRYIGARWAKGCHPGDLFSEYFTSSEYVHEYVRLNGKPDIILIDGVFSTAQEAMRREQELQYKYNVRDNNSFLNKAIAGVYNNRDPEIIEKIRKANIGHKHSDEHKKKIGDTHRGMKRPIVTGQRISAAKKGKKLSAEHAEKLRFNMLGKKHSDETKRKMGLAHLGNKSRIGQTLSDETKRKMSLVRKGRKQSIVQCPHCDKIGGSPSMHQWHFDNCKKRI